MNILVVLRMMPDAAGELELADDGRSIDREWLDFQLNDFDDHALEDAILLKESVGARVTVAAIGEGCNRVLQMAAARGADEAIALQGEEDGLISSRSIARTIANLTKAKATDLILCGVQSAEDVFGQLAPYLGGMLDWPHISGTNRLEAIEGGMNVTQERGAGEAVMYRIGLPAVLGVQTATKAPRYVSGSKLREASKTAIAKISIEDSGFERFAELTSLSVPARSGSGENLGENAELVADRLVGIFSDNKLVRN